MADSSSRNAERIKTYKENNPGVAKLNKLKYSVKVSERRASNSDFDKEWKEKEAARKRKYRAEKSLAKDEDVLVVRPKVVVVVGETPSDSGDEERGQENSAKKVVKLLWASPNGREIT